MSLDEPGARYLAGLLERATGQQLAENRSWRIDAALGPIIRDRGLDGVTGLVARLVEGHDPALQAEVIDQLLNHETFFFRDAPVFRQVDVAALHALHGARAGSRRLRIWSAGCSTGQEVYSLAMIFAEAEGRWAGWTIDLIGTDVSPSCIRRAEQGVYSSFEIQRGLPVTQMIRWFDPDRDDWRVKREIGRRARFSVHNILDPAPSGPFDLVFCRNVLLYLTPERRRQAFQRIAAALAPDGFLVLGAGETVTGHTDAFAADPDARGLFRPTAGAARMRAA